MASNAGNFDFLAGAFFAGQIMIWPGIFEPGITPNGAILNHWPEFLIGGAVCRILAPEGARQVPVEMTEN